MGLAHTLWQIAPTPVKTAAWRRHERQLRREWGVERETEEFVAEHGLIVSAGPFAGMRFPAEATRWEQCPLIPVLKGQYERDLQPFLGGPSVFIDVGSAYGYYLVGMALHGARCYGFEIDRARRKDSERLADLNGVRDRVSVNGRVHLPDLDVIPLDDALMLVDIEGAERELFSPAFVSRLRGVRVIVEYHGGSERVVEPALAASHSVKRVALDGSGAGEIREPGQFWGVFTPR